MTISDEQWSALRNLADKNAGKAVDWINIADARALTVLGLAKRTRAGWEITSEGSSAVLNQAARNVPGPAASIGAVRLAHSAPPQA